MPIDGSPLSYPGLSGVYIGLALPLMVYILLGHFRAIPKEIDEAKG
jgi:ABC-type glycerol-3-phosphate transport system permease component